MDRSLDQRDLERTRNAPGIGVPRHSNPDVLDRLRETIDRCAQDQPDLPEFFRRLERAGVQAIPSIQQTGRWNGLAFVIDGFRFKGSMLGRAYTAKGLQDRKGVRYEPARHGPDLQALAHQARGVREIRPLFPECRPPSMDRSHLKSSRGLDGITPSQREALWEIGQFRVLRAPDLGRVRYRGLPGTCERDLKTLAANGFLERRSIVVRGFSGRPKTLDVVALTKRGKELLNRSEKDPARKAQALYAGLVKPREIAHDTAIYRLYQVEAARIEKSGGVIRRIVLDYELKKKVYAPLVQARKESPAAYARKQEEVARTNGLRVVNGSIPLPDLRIEYDTARGDRTKVDLELATEDYRGAHLQNKHQAGFQVFLESALGSGGRSASDDEDHMNSILAF